MEEEEKQQLSEKDKLYKTIRYLIYFVIGFSILAFILFIILAIISMVFVQNFAPAEFSM